MLEIYIDEVGVSDFEPFRDSNDELKLAAMKNPQPKLATKRNRRPKETAQLAEKELCNFSRVVSAGIKSVLLRNFVAEFSTISKDKF